MRNKGFTLIELIVIIAVLAILVTIGVPRYLGHTKEANLTKLKHDARIIQDASDRYYIDHNDWPFLLDENGDRIIISDLDNFEVVYKVEDYDESRLSTNPDDEGSICLYKIDFEKLNPYIRKLNSDTSYFAAAVGNPEFGITVLGLKSKPDQDKVEEPIPEEPGEVGKGIREPGEGEIVIRTAEDLAKIGKDENYPLNGKYIQMADIDLSGYRDGGGWVPIGSLSFNEDNEPDVSLLFTGKFDGNGFKIRNLSINRPDENYQGLFGFTAGATLTNISLEDVNVIGDGYVGGLVGGDGGSSISNSYAIGSVKGDWSIGGLVGAAGGSSIENSHATGTVTGKYDIGGLVGLAYMSTISNSYATGKVTGTQKVGGLVGLADELTNITNSYATGKVTGREYTGGLVGTAGNSYTIGNLVTITNSYATGSVEGIYRIGGLVGEAFNSTITNSHATGTVTGTGSIEGVQYTGGLVGWAENLNITNSYATGTVTGEDRIGGLVGAAGGSSISNSYATGLVQGYRWIGGLVGDAWDSSTISNSYATGSVLGTEYTGGLVGVVENSTISNSYATGLVTGIDYTGGLVGDADESSTISNSYWDTNTTGQTSSAGGGTGLTTLEMKQRSSYGDNWDFDNIWQINEGQSYPYLRDNPQTPPPGTN